MENSWNNFHIPRVPNNKNFYKPERMIERYAVQLLLSEGQEILFVKSKAAIFLLEALGSPFCRHRWGGSERIQNEHRQNTNWFKQKQRQLVAHGDYPSVKNCRRMLHRYFVWYLEFYTAFQKFYIFISGFIAKSLTILRGTLVGTQFVML